MTQKELFNLFSFVCLAVLNPVAGFKSRSKSKMETSLPGPVWDSESNMLPGLGQ